MSKIDVYWVEMWGQFKRIEYTYPEAYKVLWRAAYAPADCQPVGVYFTPTDRQPSWGCTPPPLYSPCI
jgi:hypothetical protein